MRKALLLALAFSTGCAAFSGRSVQSEREKISISPLPATARVGEKVRFTAMPAKKDTFDLDYLWRVSDPEVLFINLSTGEAKILKPGKSDICAAPFHRYLPLAADMKTVDRKANTGIKLIVGMASLKETCVSGIVAVP